jgi:hypothetical protein
VHRRGDAEPHAPRVSVVVEAKHLDFLTDFSRKKVDEVSLLEVQAVPIDGRQQNQARGPDDDVFDD